MDAKPNAGGQTVVRGMVRELYESLRNLMSKIDSTWSTQARTQAIYRSVVRLTEGTGTEWEKRVATVTPILILAEMLAKRGSVLCKRASVVKKLVDLASNTEENPKQLYESAGRILTKRGPFAASEITGALAVSRMSVLGKLGASADREGTACASAEDCANAERIVTLASPRHSRTATSLAKINDILSNAAMITVATELGNRAQNQKEDFESDCTYSSNYTQARTTWLRHIKGLPPSMPLTPLKVPQTPRSTNRSRRQMCALLTMDAQALHAVESSDCVTRVFEDNWKRCGSREAGFDRSTKRSKCAA